MTQAYRDSLRAEAAHKNKMRTTLVVLTAFCMLSGFEKPQEEQGPGVIEKWRCMNALVWLSFQFNEKGYDDIPEDEVVGLAHQEVVKG